MQASTLRCDTLVADTLTADRVEILSSVDFAVSAVFDELTTSGNITANGATVGTCVAGSLRVLSGALVLGPLEVGESLLVSANLDVSNANAEVGNLAVAGLCDLGALSVSGAFDVLGELSANAVRFGDHTLRDAGDAIVVQIAGEQRLRLDTARSTFSGTWAGRERSTRGRPTAHNCSVAVNRPNSVGFAPVS